MSHKRDYPLIVANEQERRNRWSDASLSRYIHELGGSSPGGVSPFDHPRPIRVISALKRDPWDW